MATRRNVGRYECVLIDLNTQCDLCSSEGANRVANWAALVPALRRVIAWTKRNHAPVISSVESHRRWELSDSHAPLLCCVDGSDGQRKVEFTVLPQNTQIEVDNTLSIPVDLFYQVQQVIFRKRTDDLLANPKADRFVTQLPAAEFIIFGVGLECSIKAVALALLARDKRVSIVVDACGFWDRGAAELALRQIAAKGANLITVNGLLVRKLDRSHRYPTTVAQARRRKSYAYRVSRTPTNGTGRSAHVGRETRVRADPARPTRRTSSSDK